MIDSNRISSQVEEYIAYKRSLGYLIKIESDELRRFAKYTRDIDYDGPLTLALTMQWATLHSHYSQMYMARRLETVHTFALYVSAFDNQAQVPQTGAFGKAHRRASPHIYTNEEVLLLMEGANHLCSPDGIRSRTVATAIALMYATGLRVTELTSLQHVNVRLDDGYLFISHSKYKKDRLVPLHETVITELKGYRDFIVGKIGERLPDDYFFVSSYGRRFSTRSFEYAFQLIRCPVFGDVEKKPRLYDLRHSFACNTVKRWHLEGEDVNQKLYVLSTYMGHVHPEDTYWYLSATPELLGIAAYKYEMRFGGNGK